MCVCVRVCATSPIVLCKFLSLLHLYFCSCIILYADGTLVWSSSMCWCHLRVGDDGSHQIIIVTRADAIFTLQDC